MKSKWTGLEVTASDALDMLNKFVSPGAWTAEQLESYWTEYAEDQASDPEFYWEDVQGNAFWNAVDEYGFAGSPDDQENADAFINALFAHVRVK